MSSLFVWAIIALAPFSAIAEIGLCSGSDEFQCDNGACIPVEAKCNGNPDCPDASDETHALCYNHYCHPSRFRCAYGGCVDGTAPCGESPQCFDNSDLRLLRCRNKTAVVGDQFNCENGEKIPLYQLCDGQKHCEDGTDESVRACAGWRCAKGEFQCKYGACVAGRAKCDESSNNDCADGSDEDDVLCNRRTTVVVDDESSLSTVVNDFSYPECWTRVTPPDHGHLLVTKGPQGAIPPPTTFSVTFVVECTPPYRLDVPEEFHCERGQWSAPVSQCNLPQPGSDLCELPFYPNMGWYTVAGRPDWPGASHEMTFDSVTLNVTCSPPYIRIGPELVDCYHGKWSVDPFPYCSFPPPASDVCELPPYPYMGWYTVAGRPYWPGASQQRTFDSVSLNVTCSPPYIRIGPDLVDCYHGKWSVDPFPYCSYVCEVPNDPSVTYYCGDNYDQQCGDYVKSGDAALPKCNDHFTHGGGAELQRVKCLDKGWELLQSCEPEPDNITPIVTTPSLEETTPATKACVVPEHPEYGKYSVAGFEQHRRPNFVGRE